VTPALIYLKFDMRGDFRGPDKVESEREILDLILFFPAVSANLVWGSLGDLGLPNYVGIEGSRLSIGVVLIKPSWLNSSDYVPNSRKGRTDFECPSRTLCFLAPRPRGVSTTIPSCCGCPTMAP
jgi:hypothetical protein